MIPEKQAAVRAWHAFERLTKLGFPRRFPMVQFPNLPLIIAIVAGGVRHFVSGADGRYAAAVGYLAMGVWAYDELMAGSNWFRRLLGLSFLVITVARVAHAIQV